jgi:chromosome segregation ATPase
MHYRVPYNPGDPRTWPLVLSMSKDNKRNKVLPSCVVYGKTYMANQRLVALKKLSNSELFQRYPFNFAPGGELRNVEVIPRLEFEKWMKEFGKPLVSQTDALLASPTPAKVMPGASESSDSSSTSYYSQYRQALDEWDSDFAARLSSMEERLEMAQEDLGDAEQKLLQAEKASTEKETARKAAHERATAAEQKVANTERRLATTKPDLTLLVDKLKDEITSLEKAKEGTESKLTDTKRRLAESGQNLLSFVNNNRKLTEAKEDAESRLTVCKKELATASGQLVDSQAKAAELDRELQKIVNDLKKNDPQKRKSPGDATTPPAKRARVGEDVEQQEDLLEEGEIICRPDGMERQKDGTMSPKRFGEKMGGWKADLEQKNREHDELKQRRQGQKGR